MRFDSVYNDTMTPAQFLESMYIYSGFRAFQSKLITCIGHELNANLRYLFII